MRDELGRWLVMLVWLLVAVLLAYLVVTVGR